MKEKYMMDVNDVINGLGVSRNKASMLFVISEVIRKKFCMILNWYERNNRIVEIKNAMELKYKMRRQSVVKNASK